METRKLICDTSGMDPFRYSLKEGHLHSQDIQYFFEIAKITPITSTQCVNEFAYKHNEQLNLFVDSISENTTTVNFPEKIYLTSGGDFSKNSYSNSDIQFDVVDLQTSLGLVPNKLWQTTSQWNNELSLNDKSLVEVVGEAYPVNSALLANDYSLREQCKIQAISVYGSSSMLAGMVILSIITYQKGTHIHSCWLRKDKK